jgi:hypothetical protein
MLAVHQTGSMINCTSFVAMVLSSTTSRTRSVFGAFEFAIPATPASRFEQPVNAVRTATSDAKRFMDF